MTVGMATVEMKWMPILMNIFQAGPALEDALLQAPPGNGGTLLWTIFLLGQMLGIFNCGPHTDVSATKGAAILVMTRRAGPGLTETV